MPGVTIKNESEVNVLAVLSQLSPLHWNGSPIAPGTEHKLSSGRVWFTLSVNAWDPRRKPTALGTACRLTLVTGAAFVSIPVFVLTAVVSGLTSTVSRKRKNAAAPGFCTIVKGFKKRGVLADSKIVVVRGFKRPDGIYELYVHHIDWTDKNGNVIRSKDYTHLDDSEYAVLGGVATGSVVSPITKEAAYAPPATVAVPASTKA